MTEDPIRQSEEEREKKEEDRDGILGRLYRWYKSYDKWSGRWDWFNRLLGLFKTHTAASIATTAAATVAVGGAVVLTNPELRERWVPKFFGEQADITVETERWGSSVIFPIEGKDLAGRRAAFDVAILPPELTWAHQSSSVLSQGGTMIAENEVPERIFTPELREGLGRSGAVIAVGLASQEGQVQAETARAGRRATTAAGWLAAVVKEDAPIWVLNLGQFTGTCRAAAHTGGTGWQRPLIVVGIRSQEDGVDLAEAFADAISGKSNLPSRDCYTSFDLTRYR
jgi:hypothetical protein